MTISISPIGYLRLVINLLQKCCSFFTDEEDDRYEVIRLVGEIRDCLSRIIDSLFHNNTAKRPGMKISLH